MSVSVHKACSWHGRPAAGWADAVRSVDGAGRKLQEARGVPATEVRVTCGRGGGGVVYQQIVLGESRSRFVCLL